MNSGVGVWARVSYSSQARESSSRIIKGAALLSSSSYQVPNTEHGAYRLVHGMVRAMKGDEWVHTIIVSEQSERTYLCTRVV